MGNDQQQKKPPTATKGQIEVACMKAKYHLELMRDRKNSEIVKGEKQLVTKIRNKARNKVEEILIAERVVNGLKYAQACNLLMSYAASLKGHAAYLAENQLNREKINAWLPLIYSLIYGADHLGLSSLNEFKSVMRALNDPIAVPQLTNPEVIQLLTPTPVPEELNVYMVQMSERNEIPLEEINIVGHKFTKNYPTNEENDPNFLEMRKILAEKFSGGMGETDKGEKDSMEAREDRDSMGKEAKDLMDKEDKDSMDKEDKEAKDLMDKEDKDSMDKEAKEGKDSMEAKDIMEAKDKVVLEVEASKITSTLMACKAIMDLKFMFLHKLNQKRTNNLNLKNLEITNLSLDQNKIQTSTQCTQQSIPIQSKKIQPYSPINNPFAKQQQPLPDISEQKPSNQSGNSPTISQILRDFK